MFLLPLPIGANLAPVYWIDGVLVLGYSCKREVRCERIGDLLDSGKLDHGSADGGYRLYLGRYGNPDRPAKTVISGGVTMEVINLEILKHPINWITVVLMVLIAAIAFHFVLKWGGSPG